MPPRKRISNRQAATTSYRHPETKVLIRPEAGAQARFNKKKPTATWRHDSSLAPELQWDASNPTRKLGRLIVKTQGYDERIERKQSAAARWVAAVNRDGRFGQWSCLLLKERAAIAEEIRNRLA